MNIKSLVHNIKMRLSESGIAQRMASGAFWSTVGTALSKLFVVVAGMICSRFIMGKEVYGQYGMVKSTIYTFMNLGGYCLGVTAAKFIAERRREKAKEKIASVYYVTNGFSIVVALLMALLTLAFATPLANLWLDSPEMANPLRLAAIIVLIVVINIAQDGVIMGFEDFKGRAIVQIVGGGLQAIAMIVGAWLFGLMGGIAGFGVGFLSMALLNKVFINRNMKHHGIELNWRSFDKSDFKLLYQFSLPAMLMAILSTPIYFIIRIWLKQFGSFSVMADFDVGYSWMMLILFIPNAVGTMMLPIFSSINNDNNKFWRVQMWSLVINGATAVIVAIGLALCSGFIFRLYGKDFTDATPLVVMSFASVFAALSAVLGYSLTSLGKVWQQLFLNLVWAGTLTGFSYLFLVNGKGATGVAIAMLIAYGILLIIQSLYLVVLRTRSKSLDAIQ